MHPPTLILGLGNELRRDDGVGPALARAVYARLDRATTDLALATTTGWALLELLTSWDQAVIIDAVDDGTAPPGTLHRLPLDLDGNAAAPATGHAMTLAQTLSMGRRLDLDLPKDIQLWAVSVVDLHRFEEGLSPNLEAQIPAMAEAVVRGLGRVPVNGLW